MTPAYREFMKRAALGGCVLLLSVLPAVARRGAEWPLSGTLSGVSGLAWIDGGKFLAVHDAKGRDQRHKPRLSIVRLPTGVKVTEELSGQPITGVVWPAGSHPPADLESVARVPGTSWYLLAESGYGYDDAHRRRLRRIFRLKLDGGPRRAQAQRWPADVEDVEGTAVARVGRRLVFLYAERAEEKPQTQIVFRELDPRTLLVGRQLSRQPFRAPKPTGARARHVSALEVDAGGRLYAVSAQDPGDAGPFRSVVWLVGRVQESAGGSIRVEPVPDGPRRLASLDGLKVEGLAVRALPGKPMELFVATDDEWYGGLVRPIPLP